jgi:hypothetical protein
MARIRRGITQTVCIAACPTGRVKEKIMTKLTDLIAKLPPEVQPAVTEYAIPLARAAAEEVAAAIVLAIKGDTGAPRRLALANMTDAELAADDAAFTAADDAQAQANAESVARQHKGAETAAAIAASVVLAFL